MNYGDVLRMENESGSKKLSRKEMIDEIYRIFNVDSDDISDAAKAARVSYPNEPIQYYFLADCVRTGRNLKEDYGLEDEMGADVNDAVTQAADNTVPYQTYVVWRLWIEFDYETDAYSDFGLQPSLDNLENVAQVQLMAYAENIIYEFGDE